MTDPQLITCSDCQSRLEEFALDELAAQPCARVAEHLASGCPACNQQLSEILSGFAELAHALPMERPTMRVDRTLRGRIAAQRSPEEVRLASSVAASRKASPKSLTRRLFAAGLALAATIMAIAAWTTEQNHLKDSAEANSEWTELQLRVERANASQQFSAMPKMQFASLGRHTPEHPVSGYIVEDRLTRQWHVYAFHLPKLEDGHIYQMWFDMGNSRFVRAGVAGVDDEGTIRQLVDMPSDLGAIRALAISDEASSNSERPTGNRFIEAKLP